MNQELDKPLICKILALLDIQSASVIVLGAEGLNVQNPKEVTAALDMRVETVRDVLKIVHTYNTRVTLPMIRVCFQTAERFCAEVNKKLEARGAREGVLVVGGRTASIPTRKMPCPRDRHRISVVARS